MIIITFLALILGIISVLKVSKLLVEQYYSFSRVLGVFKDVFKDDLKMNLTLLFFIISSFFMFLIKESIYLYIISLLCFYLLIPDIPLKKYSFTRRNVLLISFSIIFYILGIFLGVYYKLNFLLMISGPFSIIFVILSYLFLFPLEKSIQYYYLQKAKKKINYKKRIIIGITGSFGKTTMKNILYSLLRVKYKISNQNHNYNTLMGLSKFINNEMDINDDVLIFELGIDHKNSMHKFKKLFNLDYAIITSIGEMHLSTFKSLDNIINEKIKIKDLLNDKGLLIINKDIEKYYKTLNIEYETYSLNDIEILNQGVIRYKSYNVPTKLISSFQFESLSGAILLSLKMNLSHQEIILGLQNIILPSRRLNIVNKGKTIIIDDSYNANLKGVLEALKILDTYKSKKIVITGGLIELGNKYEMYNRQIAIQMIKCDIIYAVDLSLNHPLCDEIIKQGYQEKLHIITQGDIKELLKSNEEEKVILFLAKGNNIYLN